MLVVRDRLQSIQHGRKRCLGQVLDFLRCFKIFSQDIFIIYLAVFCVSMCLCVITRDKINVMCWWSGTCCNRFSIVENGAQAMFWIFYDFLKIFTQDFFDFYLYYIFGSGLSVITRDKINVMCWWFGTGCNRFSVVENGA